MERSAKISDVPGREGQGRPLGLLMAFLKQGPHQPSKDAHKDRYVIAALTKEERVAARTELEALDPGPPRIFDYERPRRPTEDTEPDSVP